jgi:hypothetical protein
MWKSYSIKTTDGLPHNGKITRPLRRLSRIHLVRYYPPALGMRLDDIVHKKAPEVVRSFKKTSSKLFENSKN